MVEVGRIRSVSGAAIVAHDGVPAPPGGPRRHEGNRVRGSLDQAGVEVLGGGFGGDARRLEVDPDDAEENGLVGGRAVGELWKRVLQQEGAGRFWRRGFRIGRR